MMVRFPLVSPAFARWLETFALLALGAVGTPAHAQGTSPPAYASAAEPTYADLADLAQASAMVVRARVLKVSHVEDERAPGLAPGFGRFYIQAQTEALLTGAQSMGESVSYLVDLPIDARGRPPQLKRQAVLLFARPVAGRPQELQLLGPGSQQVWSEAREQRLRGILQDLASPAAPAKVTGVRELLYVPGNLAGEGETQIFLSTQDGSAASLTVRHSPGAPASWGVSFSELVADVGHPPLPETLTWYRLACFLPNQVPATANVSATAAARRQAETDYRMVLGELGPCRRNLGPTDQTLAP